VYCTLAFSRKTRSSRSAEKQRSSRPYSRQDKGTFWRNSSSISLDLLSWYVWHDSAIGYFSLKGLAPRSNPESLAASGRRSRRFPGGESGAAAPSVPFSGAGASAIIHIHSTSGVYTMANDNQISAELSDDDVAKIIDHPRAIGRRPCSLHGVPSSSRDTPGLCGGTATIGRSAAIVADSRRRSKCGRACVTGWKHRLKKKPAPHPCLPQSQAML
jgi:hypothetical protein